jgi:hypothetical protein
VHAAVINAALRMAVEHHAFQSGPADDEAGQAEAAVSKALLIVARGFSP